VLWELFLLLASGLLIGALGRLAAGAGEVLPWSRTLALGVAGALGGGLVTSAVIGAGHGTIAFLVSVAISALLVAVYSAFQRSHRV
jgi:uncharacterized membrane protein YeaQ/YmgE (transglycosylase-associated protein family)